MSELVFECRDCGTRERTSDTALVVHPDVREAIRHQQQAFAEAHAGCAERVARAAARLDALDKTGRRVRVGLLIAIFSLGMAGTVIVRAEDKAVPWTSGELKSEPLGWKSFQIDIPEYRWMPAPTKNCVDRGVWRRLTMKGTGYVFVEVSDAVGEKTNIYIEKNACGQVRLATD